MSEINHDYDTFLQFFPKGFAGVVAKTLIAPIDRVKFLFMASTKDFTVKSMLNEVKRIKLEEGIRSFWKGNLAQIFGTFPNKGIQYSVYGKCEKTISKILPDDNISETVAKILSGSIAGTTALLLTYPFDVIRTRLAYQTTKKLYNGIFHGFYEVVQKEGIKSMFRGITPALIGVSIYGGVTFSIFNSLKNVYPNAGINQIFAFGAFSGLAGQVLSYPFDVVRKRMLAHGFLEHVSSLKTSSDINQVNSMSQYFKMIWNHEGSKGMLKGISLDFFKSSLIFGTIFFFVHLVNYYENEDY